MEMLRLLLVKSDDDDEAGTKSPLTDSVVLDVIVGRDHAQIERAQVHLILDRDALGVFQIGQRGLHQLAQMVTQVAMSDTLVMVAGGGAG